MTRAAAVICVARFSKFISSSRRGATKTSFTGQPPPEFLGPKSEDVAPEADRQPCSMALKSGLDQGWGSAAVESGGKPEGAPERFPIAGEGASSGVGANGPQRFSVQRKMAVVARLMRGEPLELVAEKRMFPSPS